MVRPRVGRAAVVLVLVTGCVSSVGSEGRFVGGRCTTDADCDDFCMKPSLSFPEGQCATQCGSDGWLELSDMSWDEWVASRPGCPKGSVCFATVQQNDSGYMDICFPACKRDEDCRDRYHQCRPPVEDADVGICELISPAETS